MSAIVPSTIPSSSIVADSAEATGLKWAAPAGGATYVGVNVSRTTQGNVANDTLTAIDFNAETNDSDGFHSNTVNPSRLTIPTGKGGKYLMFAALQWQKTFTDGTRKYEIKKNGSTLIDGADFGNFYGRSGGTGTGQITCRTTSVSIQSLAAGDYVQMFAYQQSGSDKQFDGDDSVPNCTTFGLIYLGA